MKISENWHKQHVELWAKILEPFKGQPNVRALEIGTYEGAAAVWLLENILTDPTALLVCIDSFEGSPGTQVQRTQQELYDTWTQNLRASGHSDRVELRGFARSAAALRSMHPAIYRFDFIYVDGSHRSQDVLEDAVLAFPLLEPGGLMIFDDYEWNQFQGTPEHPKEGIDAFLAAYAHSLEVIYRGYQLIIRKRWNT